MENSNVNKLSFGASLTAKLSSLILLVLQLYCGLIFYNGIVSTYYYARIGFVDGNFVERAKYIIEWAKNVLGDASVFPGLLLTLHFIVFVIAALNFLISFIRFFGLFFGKEEKAVRNYKNSYIITKKFVGTSAWMLFFMLIASWVVGYRILNSAKLLIIVVAAGILVSRLARCILAKTPFMTFVCQIIYCAIFFAIIGLIMIFCSSDVISVVKYNIDVLSLMKEVAFKEKLPIILSTVAYVAIGLIMLNVIVMVRSCKTNVTVPNKSIKNSGACILVLAIVFIVLSMLVVKKFEWEIIKTYLMFLLVALSAYFFGKIEPKLEKKKPHEDPDEDPDDDAAPTADGEPDEAHDRDPYDKTPADMGELDEDELPEPEREPKVLYIGKRVKKIKSKKYRNRTDIDTIVIPKSVYYIEGYSFFGCNSVKEIRCVRKTKPRFWHSEWSFGCPANIVWDCENVDSTDEK